MSHPDFEISIDLRARELVARVPPDTETEGENVAVTRRQKRGGLPARLDPGERYEDVVVAQQLVGEQRFSRADADEEPAKA